MFKKQLTSLVPNRQINDRIITVQCQLLLSASCKIILAQYLEGRKEGRNK